MWLKLEPDQSRIRVTWGTVVESFPAPHETGYSIDAGAMNRAAKEVRSVLSDLSNLDSGDQDVRRTFLSQLAVRSHYLWYELFNAVDERDRGKIPNLIAWIETQAVADKSLVIQSCDNLHVPWGLVLHGSGTTLFPPAKPPADYDQLGAFEQEIVCCDRFWCLKWKDRFWAQQSGATPTEKMQGVHDAFGLISLYNDALLKDYEAQTDSPVDPIGRCHTPPIGFADSKQRFESLLAAAEGDIVLNYFGHHEDLSLKLAKEVISYSEFSELVDKLDERIAVGKNSSWGLIFLNGCGSAIGDAEMSLRRVAKRSTLAGVIATEARVPVSYAARFGNALIEGLASGSSVGSVMTSLYRTESFWPMSLLYGAYAYPRYKIEKPSVSTGSVDGVAA